MRVQPFRFFASSATWHDYGFVHAIRYAETDIERHTIGPKLTSKVEGEANMTVQFGDSPQANRVRRILSESNGALRDNPEAQAAFLTGSCCRRIEQIQDRSLGSAPFREKYKGLRLSQKALRQLFVDASAKAQAYEDDEHIVSNLLTCTAEAFRACAETWQLTSDEISFYFALGLSLAGRLAKGSEDQENGSGKRRMKDYYDIALLSRMYPFNGEQLIAAISATFRHRGTRIEAEPAGLTEAYYEDPARALQWRAFVRRSRFTAQPDDLKQLVAEVRRFASPLLVAASEH